MISQPTLGRPEPGVEQASLPSCPPREEATGECSGMKAILPEGLLQTAADTPQFS